MFGREESAEMKILFKLQWRTAMNVSFTVWLKDSGSFVVSHPEWKTERLALVIWTKSALVEHARYVLYWFPVTRKKWWIWKHRLFPFFCVCADGKHSKIGAFRKRWSHHDHWISLAAVFLRHKSKITAGGCCVLKLLRLSVRMNIKPHFLRYFILIR